MNGRDDTKSKGNSGGPGNAGRSDQQTANTGHLHTPNARIIGQAPKAQQVPASPATETDPKLVPDAIQMVEKSKPVNDNNNPTNGIGENVVTDAAASPDTALTEGSTEKVTSDQSAVPEAKEHQQDTPAETRQTVDPASSFKGDSSLDNVKGNWKPELRGGTGGTGGPGQEKESTTIGASNPNHKKKNGGAAALTPDYFAPGTFGDDPMLYQYKHLVGTTGAMGGKGDDPNITKLSPGQSVTPKDMVDVKTEFERKLENLDEKKTLEFLHEQMVVTKEVINTALANQLSVAWPSGGFFSHQKKLILKRNGNWGEEIEPILKELGVSRRTMDKYVNIYSTPGILNHPGLGIDLAEEAIQAMKPVLHMLDKEDPLADFLKINGMPLDYSQVKRRDLRTITKNAIATNKMRRNGIPVDYKITSDFIRLAKKVTPIDLAVMNDRKERGLEPLDYMREVIAANGARPGAREEEVPVKRRIKYFNGESVKMVDQIKAILEDDSTDKDKIDKTHLETLRNAVNDLFTRFFS